MHTRLQRKGAESTSAGQTVPSGTGKGVSSKDQNRGTEMVCQFVFNRASGLYAGYLAGLCCSMLASDSVLGVETWEGLCVAECVCQELVLSSLDCEVGLRLDEV